jgi:hypothetical protein
MSEEFDRLARRVYSGARDGAVDREAAFDLACLLMDAKAADPVVAELAEAAAEGTDRERLAALAQQVLSDRFEPGFDLEPGWLTALEEALQAVRADLLATGLPGTATLVRPGWSPANAFVDYQGGYGSTGGIAPAAGRDALLALLSVADEAQDAVMEAQWATWPVCPAHQLGVHAREHDGAAVWWCTGGGGHVAAAVGQWRQ